MVGLHQLYGCREENSCELKVASDQYVKTMFTLPLSAQLTHASVTSRAQGRQSASRSVVAWWKIQICSTYLSLAIRPEVCTHANDVVQSRVGALVNQERAQSTQRVYYQAGLDGSVESGASEQRQRPFPSKSNESQDHVENLQYWNRFYGAIEILCQEVPEDFRPEECLKRSGYLVCRYLSAMNGYRLVVAQLTSSSCEDDQASPVVFD